MIALKGGYYIDELNSILNKYACNKLLDSFYRNNIGFELKGIESFINFDKVNPLLKVVWNIITRGDATRASIKVSDFALKSFGDDYKGFSNSSPEVIFNLSILFVEDDISELLENYQLYNDINILEKNSDIRSLYKCISSLILIAQIQRCIIIMLMQNDKVSSFEFEGIDQRLIELAIDDLNDLFDAINHMLERTEKKLPLITLSKGYNSASISINKKKENGICLFQTKEVSATVFDKVLTDRNINYSSFGETKEEEKDDIYIQHFAYYTEKYKESLEYLLQNIFRKTSFRPGQEAIINRALRSLDVIGLLPTGGGKSLTYQLCSLLQPGVTIVVDPINSLMKDQYDKLIENGISKTKYINSFNTRDERNKNMELLRDGKLHFIFVSPERFQIDNFRNTLSKSKNNNVYFSYAVIDEAHCVSEWGHDFRHVYLNLAQNLKRFCISKKDTISIFGLTATASFDVLADVQRELNVANDAIISLPAEAIDRKELNYQIIPIDAEIENKENFWERERQIGLVKHPKLKRFISSLPDTINTLETKYGYLRPDESFFRQEGGKYKNGGVIFCPTKSERLPNGVMSIKEGLSDLHFIKPVTFFGDGGDDVIISELIESQANLSIENQESFLKNDANLMIATKAFGMGIDKPNIRYSIHYSFPNSVESFYQEAGRAGRDRSPSICSILYHPDDILTNKDFYYSSFRGVDREKDIINELLEEVRYEDGFFLNLVIRIVKEKYPTVGTISLWSDRYLNVFGQYGKDIRIGKIDLNHSDLRHYDNWRQNIDKSDSEEILEFIRDTLRKESGNQNIKDWLSTKSTDGIKTLIESRANESYDLKIGFNNDISSRMADKIRSDMHSDFEDRIIRAAYHFSTNRYDFIEQIEINYRKFKSINHGTNNSHFNPSTQTIEYLKSNYYKIRSTSDTLRCIHRMNILGIIDDYVIDYANRYITITFKAKEDAQYTSNFENYLRRYLGHERTNSWLEKIDTIEDDSILRRVLFILIDFTNSEIFQKRENSIKYMQDLCEVFIAEGEQEFRDRMVRYFTSKYARSDYLPLDTENGRKENCDIVIKYINYINNPPDQLGGEIDNAKHLRGACDNLRISMVENASIDLLTAFSIMVLELKKDHTIMLANEVPAVKKSIELYRSGFKRMLRIEPWEKVQELIELFNIRVLSFNSEIKELMESLSSELLINRTSYKLKELLDKIS